jgi:hypothetical protein
MAMIILIVLATWMSLILAVIHCASWHSTETSSKAMFRLRGQRVDGASDRDAVHALPVQA